MSLCSSKGPDPFNGHVNFPASLCTPSFSMEKSTNSPGAKAVDGSKNELMSPSSSSSVKKSQAENAPAAPAVKSDHAVFHCKSQSVKTLCTLLPCMRAEAKDQVIILTISAKSVLFVVEDSGKCMQANAFFDAEQHFDVFEVSFPEGAPQVIEVALNLKVSDPPVCFVDCVLVVA